MNLALNTQNAHTVLNNFKHESKSLETKINYFELIQKSYLLDVSSGAEKLLNVLSSYYSRDKSNSVYPANRTLELRLKCSDGSLRKYKNELVQKGLLIIIECKDEKDAQISNSYFLTKLIDLEILEKEKKLKLKEGEIEETRKKIIACNYRPSSKSGFKYSRNLKVAKSNSELKLLNKNVQKESPVKIKLKRKNNLGLRIVPCVEENTTTPPPSRNYSQSDYVNPNNKHNMYTTTNIRM